MAKQLLLPKDFQTGFVGSQRRPLGQLEVDFNNPLAHGLVSVMIPNGSKTVDLLRAGQGSIVTGVDAKGDTSSGRPAFNFTDTTNSRITRTDKQSADISVLSRVKYNNTTSDHALFDINNQILVFFADTASSNLRTAIFAGSTTFGASGGLPSGEWVDFGAKANSAANLGSTYINGVKDIDNQGIGGGVWENSANWGFGANFSAAGKESNANYEFFFLWNRELTDAEFKSLNNNPYQILKLVIQPQSFFDTAPAAGRIMGGLAWEGGLAGVGGLAGSRGGLCG